MERLVELVKQPNGYLRIQLTEAGMDLRDELRAEYPPDRLEAAHDARWLLTKKFPGYGYVVAFEWEWIDYWLEYHICNGWELVRPEEIGALTGDANTLLTDTAERNEYGELTACETVWFDNMYAVRDPVEELLAKGYVELWPAEVESAA